MNLTFLILGIVVIIGFIFWIAKKDSETYETEMGEEFCGICAVPLDTTVRKQANLAKVLELFINNSELTNEEYGVRI